MAITANLNYLRIAPRKVRLVAELIRGKTAKEAGTILNFTTKKAAKPFSKLLKSALANARHNLQIEEENLYISKLLVNEGPKLKRWRARARGQSYEIQKKTSHITLVLEEIVKKPKKKLPKRKTEKEEKIKMIPTSGGTLEREEISPKESKLPKDQPKFEREVQIKRSKISGGMQKVFRRKAF